MAARAAAADVEAIIETTVSSAVIDSAFIAAATLVVDRVAAACPDLTDDELKQIEIWYSAHLLAAFDPILVKEKFEGAANTYQRGSNTQVGILSTVYGQNANTLSGGCLLDEDKRAPVVTFA